MAVEELRERRKRFRNTMAAIEGASSGSAGTSDPGFDFAEVGPANAEEQTIDQS